LSGSGNADVSRSSASGVEASRNPAASLERARINLAAHDVQRQLTEFAIVIARVPSQCVEGGVHVNAIPLGEHAFRLLDDDPTVERVLKLLRHHRAAMARASLQDADGGNVGQRLREPTIIQRHRMRGTVKHVQSTDGLSAKAQWNRSYRPESDRHSCSGEHRPAGLLDLEIIDADRCT
jgi:hypothetical protein